MNYLAHLYMSIFTLLDPNRNTIAENIIPSGTSASSASLNMQAPVVIEQSISSSGSSAESFIRLTDNGTSYTMLSTDSIVSIESDTYTTILIPDAVASGGKKFTVIRSFDGPGTVYVSLTEPGQLIDGQYSTIQLTENNQVLELVSNKVTWLSR